MKGLLRDKDGVLTHILYTVNNGTAIYLSKRGIDLVRTHEITQGEVENWVGDDNKEGIVNSLLEVVNEHYTLEQFRYDVISHNGLLENEEIKIKTL